MTTEHRMYPEGLGHHQSAKDAVIENYWSHNVLPGDENKLCFHPDYVPVWVKPVLDVSTEKLETVLTKKESVLKAMKRFKQVHPGNSIT